MESTRLNSRGQITLPKIIIDRLGLRPGDRVAFLTGKDGGIEMRPIVDLKDLWGSLRADGRYHTIEDMEHGLGAAIEESFRHSSK